MAILFVLLAGIFGSIVNYCFRKNFEKQSSAKGYLSLYFIFSFAISFLFYSNLSIDSFSTVMSSIGMFAGTLNLIMMLLVALALQVGPSGLTFAFQNSACIFPTLLLFLLFGSSYGFELTIPAITGFALLLTGLFLSARKSSQGNTNAHHANSFKKWVFIAISVFLIQGVILSIFQWRTLLLCPSTSPHFLIPWSCSSEEDTWFMPGFFLIPALFQTLSFGISERRWFSKRELLLGTAAGLFNGAGTFCLLGATKFASPEIRLILFPLFAVTVILLCNLWSSYFYKEPIEWKGMTLCLAGVFVAAL
jgi:hypothetical protein